MTVYNQKNMTKVLKKAAQNDIGFLKKQLSARA